MRGMTVFWSVISSPTVRDDRVLEARLTPRSSSILSAIPTLTSSCSA